MNIEISEEVFAKLASILPTTDPTEVINGLDSSFYITGTYDGDVELISAVNTILVKYNIGL